MRYFVESINAGPSFRGPQGDCFFWFHSILRVVTGHVGALGALWCFSFVSYRLLSWKKKKAQPKHHCFEQWRSDCAFAYGADHPSGKVAHHLAVVSLYFK
jgi:hypothetical protein